MRWSKNTQKQYEWKGGTWSRDLVQNQRRIWTESHSEDQYLCEGWWAFVLYSGKNGVCPAMNSPVTSYKHFWNS